jgi:hypothetical protein
MKLRGQMTSYRKHAKDLSNILEGNHPTHP